MKINTGIFAVLLTVMVSPPSTAQVGATGTRDDSVEVAPGGTDMTDSQLGTGPASVADVSSAPIAFGVVSNNGQKQSGTANWSSAFNATYKRYEITITGQNYYYLSFTTLVTPAGDNRFCRTDSVGGKLLVYCYDQSGSVQPARLAFTTFKAP
jgi:hypothetical protein